MHPNDIEELKRMATNLNGRDRTLIQRTLMELNSLQSHVRRLEGEIHNLKFAKNSEQG